jgi:hypothetical protein
MDEPDRPTDHWLPLLGGLLLVEALTATYPSLAQEGIKEIPGIGTGAIPVYYASFVFLPALFGAATLVASRRRSGYPLPASLPWLAALSIIGGGFSYLFSLFEYSSRWAVLPMFGYASSVLHEMAAPVLWGSALARREEPGNLRAQKVGRISAGLVQLGFVFLFVSELQNYSWFEGRNISDPGTGAVFALLQGSTLAERLLLLWCSILSVRRAADESLIRLRARKIHRLMSVWMWLVGLSWISSVAYYRLLTPGSEQTSVAYQSWRLALLISIQLSAAFAVAGRFRTAVPQVPAVRAAE